MFYLDDKKYGFITLNDNDIYLVAHNNGTPENIHFFQPEDAINDDRPCQSVLKGTKNIFHVLKQPNLLLNYHYIQRVVKSSKLAKRGLTLSSIHKDSHVVGPMKTVEIPPKSPKSVHKLYALILAI